jgi:hypothetical protein
MRKFSLGFRAMAGAAGTVCGRENAVTCCMNSAPKVSLNRGKINAGFASNRLVLIVDHMRPFSSSRAKVKVTC